MLEKNLENDIEDSVNNNSINLDNNSYIGIITNFNWLVYKTNSCRYDTFITFYVFCVYEYLEDIINSENIILKEIHNIISIIKKNPCDKTRELLWRYVLINKLILIKLK